jgi:glycosyltransferase involved in cell wall biosynthesis
MKRKNILFLASWYPSKKSEFGGDFVQRHAIAASKFNNITALFTTKVKNQKENYFVTETYTKGVKEIVVYYSESLFPPFNFIKRFIAYQKGLKRIPHVDLVHLNVSFPAGPFALYLKYFKGLKYVISEHWTTFEPKSFQKLPFLKRLLIKKVLKEASYILPVSSDLGNNIQKIYAHPHIEIIPNVVNVDLFQPTDSKRKKGITKFLHLSSLKESQKNVSGMLRVAKRLADANFRFEFHMGGTGNLNEIEDFIKKNNLSTYIKTIHPLPYEEVGKFMNQFDCFILFSNFETQSCVRLESFSVGIPFIGTDIGGVNEFFPKDYGILIEKGNEDQLYESMKEIIEGKEFAPKEKMHQYVVDHFSLDVIAKKFNDIYIQISSNE